MKIARNQSAALFVSIHADALPRREGDAQGATIYTLSDRASDAEAERLAEAENKADAIGGVNLTEEPTEVADILIDLAQRETRTFSNRFARLLMGEMKNTVRMHKNPLKSAGFKGAEGARRAVGADRTRLCLEQGRPRTSGVGELAFPDRWIDGAGHRCLLCQTAGNGRSGELNRGNRPMMEALVWPQRLPYKKAAAGFRNRSKLSGRRIIGLSDGGSVRACTRILPHHGAGLKRNFDNALAGAVLGFSVHRRNRRVSGRRRRGGGADLALFQGLAGLFAASGL